MGEPHSGLALTLWPERPSSALTNGDELIATTPTSSRHAWWTAQPNAFSSDRKLLYESPEGAQIKSLIDHSIFVEARKEEVRAAVIKRHVEGGRSVDDASSYYDTVDANNFSLVMKTKGRADEIIRSYFFAKNMSAT